jgi:hypothetical protein
VVVGLPVLLRSNQFYLIPLALVIVTGPTGSSSARSQIAHVLVYDIRIDDRISANDWVSPIIARAMTPGDRHRKPGCLIYRGTPDEETRERVRNVLSFARHVPGVAGTHRLFRRLSRSILMTTSVSAGHISSRNV